MEESPPVLESPPDAPPPPAMSLAARLLNVFAIPGEVFMGVKASRLSIGNWLVPALLSAVVGVVAAIVIVSQPVMQRQMHDLRLGFAASLDSDVGRLMIGAAGRYMSGSVLNTGQQIEGFGTDFGVGASISNFRAGLVLRNAVRVDNVETPRRVAAGVGWVNDHVLIDADAAWGTDAYSGPAYRAGIGFQPGEEGFQVRGGYAFDQTVPDAATRHFVSLGVSWRTPSFSVDLSGAMNVVRVSETIVALGVGFVLPTAEENN